MLHATMSEECLDAIAKLDSQELGHIVKVRLFVKYFNSFFRVSEGRL